MKKRKEREKERGKVEVGVGEGTMSRLLSKQDRRGLVIMMLSKATKPSSEGYDGVSDC